MPVGEHRCLDVQCRVRSTHGVFDHTTGCTGRACLTAHDVKDAGCAQRCREQRIENGSYWRREAFFADVGHNSNDLMPRPEIELTSQRGVDAPEIRRRKSFIDDGESAGGVVGSLEVAPRQDWRAESAEESVCNELG